MLRTFLSSYTVRLRQKRTDTYLCLSSFLNNQDLLSIVDRYFGDRAGPIPQDVHPQSGKMLRVTQYAPRHRQIHGIIETGEYGYESTLFDVNTNSVSYLRSTTDAEMLPFYFLINIPSQLDEGILLLQRTGSHGIRDVLLQDFTEYFKMMFPNIVVEAKPIGPRGCCTSIPASWPYQEGEVCSIYDPLRPR